MSWRSAIDARDYVSEDASFDVLDRLLSPGERPQLVATPHLYKENPALSSANGPFCLIVTQVRVLVAKKKLGGRVKIVWERPIGEFRRFSTGLWMDAGPKYEYYAQLNRGHIWFMFETNDAAEAVANAIRASVSASNDPTLTPVSINTEDGPLLGEWIMVISDCFVEKQTDPGLAMRRVWPLFQVCPEHDDEYMRVEALAKDTIDPDRDIDDLVNLFCAAVNFSPPTNGEAASCYWSIAQLSGESLLVRATRDGRQDAIQRWVPTFMDVLARTPQAFTIGRMRQYSTGEQPLPWA